MRGDKTLEEIFRLLIKPLLQVKHPDVDEFSHLEMCFETKEIGIKVFRVKKGAEYLVRRRLSFQNWFYTDDRVKIKRGDLLFVRSDKRLSYVEVEVVRPYEVDSQEYRFEEFEWLRLLSTSEELLCDESHVFSAN